MRQDCHEKHKKPQKVKLRDRLFFVPLTVRIFAWCANSASPFSVRMLDWTTTKAQRTPRSALDGESQGPPGWRTDLPGWLASCYSRLESSRRAQNSRARKAPRLGHPTRRSESATLLRPEAALDPLCRGGSPTMCSVSRPERTPRVVVREDWSGREVAAAAFAAHFICERDVFHELALTATCFRGFAARCRFVSSWVAGGGRAGSLCVFRGFRAFRGCSLI